MSQAPRPYPDHVPTLTEVIELGPVPLAVPAVILPEAPPPPLPLPSPLSSADSDVSEAQLTHRVLVDVQRQIDSMLEFRLRESMQPLLAQFIETLMQDLRDELSRTMRDVVTRAVAQEMAKLRNR
ncbi:MAG: hypothetical protein KGL90_03405 [Burkholderiales bacterium]|nr:hypothetical protein [Burkholderiales bacterium]